MKKERIRGRKKKKTTKWLRERERERNNIILMQDATIPS